MSLHADAVAVLSAWEPFDERQDGLRRDYLGHLGAHPDGVYKACPGAHVTASALVVDALRERVLLTLHAKIGRWLQTGGHCEPADPALAAAALREATEESGISGLTLLGGAAPVVLDRHETPCALHLDVQYVVAAPEGAVEVISPESLDLRWFAADALPDDVDASVRALVARARALG